MSGDHLNKLAVSSSTASLTNQKIYSHGQSTSYTSSANSHNPVKLALNLNPLNHRYVKISVGGRLFT